MIKLYTNFEAGILKQNLYFEPPQSLLSVTHSQFWV